MVLKTELSSKYELLFSAPTVKEFVHLRKKLGWDILASEVIELSLVNSLFHVIIRHNSVLVAMARVVGDGAMYFYIQDVIVDPADQNNGLGNYLMHYVEEYLLKTTTTGATIGLLAAKGKEPFYEKFGYTLRPNDSLGNGMCKFMK